MVEPSVHVRIPIPGECREDAVEPREEYIKEEEKSLSSLSCTSTHGPFKVNPISCSRKSSPNIDESCATFQCPEKSETIVALIWGALVLFIGVIFVVAEFNTPLEKYSFTTTYWVLFTLMLVSIIGMLIAILNRKNKNFVYKKVTDEESDVKSDRNTNYLLVPAYILSIGNFMIDMFSILTVFHCGLGGSAIHERSRYVNIFAFHALRIIFTSTQLTFLQIFLEGRIRRSYLFRHKVLLAHLIATNFTIWFTFLSQDTGIMNRSDNGAVGEYDVLNCTSTPNNSVFRIAKYANPYLTPFILGFNLLTGALFYSLIPYKTFIYEELDLDHHRKYNYGAIDQVKRDNSKIYRSQPALLIGILIGLLLFLSSCTLHDRTHYAENLKFSYLMHTMVHVTMMAASLRIIWELKKYHTKRYLRMNYRIDDYLLFFTGIAGFLPFLVMVLFSVFKYKENEDDVYSPQMRALLGVMVLVNIGSVLTQTFILLIARSYKRVAFSHKPSDSSVDFHDLRDNYTKLRSTARIGQCLVLLLVLNISMWIVTSTLEINSSLNHTYLITTVYWSRKVWLFVTRLLYPVLIFYRIHSTAMIANIWVNFRVKKKVS